MEDKEKEICDAKDQLCQAKEEVIREFRDFHALLLELGGFFAEGFDDALSEVKASYPDLDISHINIDAMPQTLVHPFHSKSTDDLFVNDAPINDPIAESPSKTVAQVEEGKEGNSPVQQ